MLCHKCPHSAEISRLRESCLKCLKRDEEARRGGHGKNRGIDNLSNKGRSFESIDAYPDPDMVLERRIRTATRSKGERLTPLPPDAEERLREALAGFLRLTFIDQMLLVWLLRGGTISSFARMEWMPQKVGIKRQTAAAHVERLKRDMPRLADMIQGLIDANAPSGSRKNCRRRKRRKGGE